MKKQSAVMNGNKHSVRPIIVGITTSIVTAAVGAGVVAALVGQGTLDEANMKMVMVLLNLLATFVGGTVAVMMAKKSVLVVAGIVAAGYFLLLLCGNLLFIEGGMVGVLPTILMIFVGATGAVLVGIRNIAPKKTRTRRGR